MVIPASTGSDSTPKQRRVKQQVLLRMALQSRWGRSQEVAAALITMHYTRDGERYEVAQLSELRQTAGELGGGGPPSI
jgi:hypothetical protein